jgi:hypothetical protein
MDRFPDLAAELGVSSIAAHLEGLRNAGQCREGKGRHNLRTT